MSVTLLWAALRDAWTNSDETVKLKVNLRVHGSLSTLSLCLNGLLISELVQQQ